MGAATYACDMSAVKMSESLIDASARANLTVEARGVGDEISQKFWPFVCLWPPTQSLTLTTLSSLTFNAHMCDMILVSGGTPCFLTTENTFFLMRPAIS